MIVLFVNFTTHDRFSDGACTLNAGDHPFLKHQTAIEYARAKLASDAVLEALRAANRLQILEPLTPAVLTRIREGAVASTRMKIEMAQVLIDQELVDEL